jgi:hypothetical protein
MRVSLSRAGLGVSGVSAGRRVLHMRATSVRPGSQQLAAERSRKLHVSVRTSHPGGSGARGRGRAVPVVAPRAGAR